MAVESGRGSVLAGLFQRAHGVARGTNDARRKSFATGPAAVRTSVRSGSTMDRASIFTLIFVAFFAPIAGCATKKAADSAESSEETTSPETGVATAPDDAAEPVYERGRPIRIGAANFRVSVLDRRAWPESETGAVRVGYLRHGAIVEAYEHPFVNDECKEGWYELVAGGFVCAKAVTPELSSPRVRLAPKQPDTSAGMPYRYGVNLRDGTPLYRRVLSNDDRKKYEPWLAPPKADESEGAKSGEASGGDSKVEAAGEGAKDVAKTGEIAKVEAPSEGAGSAGIEKSAAKTATADEESAAERPSETSERVGAKSEEESAAARKKSDELDAGVDASKPKLRELRGRGVLVRKMVRGFSLALDRDFKAAGTRWWRTTYGFAVPYDRIMVQPGKTKYHGAWFGPASAGDAGDDEDAGATMLGWDGAARPDAMESCPDAGAGVGAPTVVPSPELANAVGFVLGGSARKFGLAPCAKRVTWGEELPKRSAVMLTGEGVKIGGIVYQRTSDGSFVVPTGLTFAKPAPPADLAPDEKWIDVDLTRQTLVAFEGTRPVFATLVSTGRLPRPDETEDFRTRTGTFRIREKHVSTTMDGDVASDGPYSIEDVPWVMYYDGSYALHGAFWHDRFGHTRSHGCVNLAPDDARTVFGWSEPRLPEGWHGVMATEVHPGTRVVVHEDRPAKAR